MLLSSTTLNGAVSNDSNNNITMSVGNTVIANVNSSGIYFESGKKAIYTGAVLQVVQSYTQSLVSTTSKAFVTTNLAASITPTFATSKILVRAIIPVVSTTNQGPGFLLNRNGTNIWNPSAQDGSSQYYYLYGSTAYVPIPLEYLDSPSSTSAQTYTIYMSSYNATSTISMPFGGGVNNATAVITLMEIAG